MKIRTISTALLSLCLPLFWSACATSPTPKPAKGAVIEPAAQALAAETAAKLEAAGTIKVQALHQLDPSLGLGNRLDGGDIKVTVKRPNHFHASQPAGQETREVVYNGTTLLVMMPQLGLHAEEKLPTKTIDQFAHVADKRFGFRPALAELLSENLVATLFADATAVRAAGKETIAGVPCEILEITQDGQITELWIATGDRLPRRLRYTFTDLPGNPTWDIRFTRWHLDEEVDDSVFAARPAEDSYRMPMLKSR